MISTDEQDGWAYVATGSETYALWVRQRDRMRTQLDDMRRCDREQQAVTDYFRARN
jgi:hypothetical protein